MENNKSYRIGSFGEMLFDVYFKKVLNTTHKEHYDFITEHNIIEVKTTTDNRFNLKKLQHKYLKEHDGYYCFIEIAFDATLINFYFVPAIDIEWQNAKEKTSKRISQIRSLANIHFVMNIELFNALTEKDLAKIRE